MSKKSEFQRLSSTIRPKHYNLELNPDLVELTFEGKTSVEVEIFEATKRIELNALDLTIKNVSFHIHCKSGDTKILHPKSINNLTEQERIEFEFDEDLPICAKSDSICSKCILHIEFTGILNDKMKGFYRSKYVTASGEERYAGVTQFESTDARRCFPCWDEPAIKATFDITLMVAKDRTALSNMPIISDEIDPNNEKCRIVKFDRTPIMSTYLVAVVIGEYDYVEDKSTDGVIVRVYTPIGKKQQGEFALYVATKVLPYYKDYFKIAYPLPKMDLIAIADFSAGAMENWGLITYRETYLLVDPENTSLIRKQSIALTIGHEIAHQWFGNLVTMEWWTHLWLNEGYASFVEFLCVDFLFPEYDIWTQFVTDMYTKAMELDCLENSHPIEVPVSHPSEIDEIFDEISYNKGASVIRMLHDFVGDEDFREGMNNYLTRYQYKNTQTKDLWLALEEESDKPITSIMSTWITQMGFPVVTVSSTQLSDSKCELTLTQSKFTADGQLDKDNLFWLIPITISTSNLTMPKQSFILDNASKTISLDNISENDWIKINPNSIGYYRTRYTSDMLDKLIVAVRNLTITPLDRLGLIDDLFALVQAGHSNTTDALKLIEAYRNETDYTVWTAITNSLIKLQILLSHTALINEFNEFGIRLYKPLADRLGWDAKPNESHLDTLLRTLVLNRLISYDCMEVITEANKRFEKHITGECIISADLRTCCYRAYLASHTNKRAIDKLIDMYRTTDLHEEKDRIARALGTVKDTELLKYVVTFSMSSDVRLQDAIIFLAGIAINPKGRDYTWEFFRKNYISLYEKYQGGFLITRLIKSVTENFVSHEKADEVTLFFKENKCPGTERTISQSIETINLNTAWLIRDLGSIHFYLKSPNINE